MSIISKAYTQTSEITIDYENHKVDFSLPKGVSVSYAFITFFAELYGVIGLILLPLFFLVAIITATENAPKLLFLAIWFWCLIIPVVFLILLFVPCQAASLLAKFLASQVRKRKKIFSGKLKNPRAIVISKNIYLQYTAKEDYSKYLLKVHTYPYYEKDLKGKTDYRVWITEFIFSKAPKKGSLEIIYC